MNKLTEDYYIKAAEKLGWTLEFDKNQATLHMYSSEGQDVNFEISFDNEEDFLEKIQNEYENYDPSEESYIWLDDTGHGKKGAPYEMIDVYNDMIEVESKLHELSDYFAKISHETVKKIVFAIQRKRFSFERQQKVGIYNGNSICVTPFFCSYGQIGYDVEIPDADCTISYDYELKEIDIE